MHTPFLPLFVFDGPRRPGVKRGKKVGKEAHWMTGGMKNIIEAFGYEWRTVSYIEVAFTCLLLTCLKGTW
jgi:Holliday junction resolvase YEN1